MSQEYTEQFSRSPCTVALVKSVIGQSGLRKPRPRKPLICGTLDPSRKTTGAFRRDSLENPSPTFTARPVLLASDLLTVETLSPRQTWASLVAGRQQCNLDPTPRGQRRRVRAAESPETPIAAAVSGLRPSVSYPRPVNNSATASAEARPRMSLGVKCWSVECTAVIAPFNQDSAEQGSSGRSSRKCRDILQM